MLKALLGLLVLLGFAWAYVPTRVRMVRAVEPVMEALGPAGDFVTRPIERYNASTEIKFLLDQLRMHRNEGRDIPDERTFQSWIAKHVSTRNKGRDPWNHPYFMFKVGGQVTIGSPGRDGVRGTADDIRESIGFGR